MRNTAPWRRGPSLGMDETWYTYINSLHSADNASLTMKGIVRVCSAVWCIRHPRYASAKNSFPSARVKVCAGLGIVGLKALEENHSFIYKRSDRSTFDGHK